MTSRKIPIHLGTSSSYKLSRLPKIGTARDIFVPVKACRSSSFNSLELLQDILEEQMNREKTILASSPHKPVVQAVRYAKTMNMTLAMDLEKSLDNLFCKFEQEYRRIVEIQNDILSEYPGIFLETKLFGQTRKQFRRHLNNPLELKQRQEELHRTKMYLLLPGEKGSTEYNSRRSRRDTEVPMPHSVALSPWKHDTNVVYLPPI